MDNINVHNLNTNNLLSLYIKDGMSMRIIPKALVDRWSLLFSDYIYKNLEARFFYEKG